MEHASAGRRPLVIVGAPSSIGIRPYDDGRIRELHRTPGVLRSLGLVSRLGARDLGDVDPPAYQDFARPTGRPRNEAGLVDYSRALANRVGAGMEDGSFTLVLGGDCSIVLGSLLGAWRRAERVALAYVDAHADFATPRESATGSAASMCLAMAVGRGDTALARLAGDAPLVRGDDVVLVGRRDDDQPHYGQTELAPCGVLELEGPWPGRRDAGAVARAALERLAGSGVGGFWIHVDADVLDGSVMPAVDSPSPGGPDVEQLAALLRPLARHPRALGMQLTIYDPGLDPDLACARRLVDLLETVLADAPATA
jgi:arginase